MPAIGQTKESYVTLDEHSGAIRNWMDVLVAPSAKAPFSASQLARQTLEENADAFKWHTDLADLREIGIRNGKGYSVRFGQEFQGLPVDSSEVVVNIFGDGRVFSVYNAYHYDIPRDLNVKPRVDREQVRQLVARILSPVYEQFEIGGQDLIVYQYHRVVNQPPKPGAGRFPNREALLERLADADTAADAREGMYFLAWDIRVATLNPTDVWRVLIDADSGNLIQVIDLSQYATGAGRAFDPNPIVTSGNTTLSSATALATLNGLTEAVVMERLNVADAAGNLHLDGSFVNMADAENPVFAEPVSGLGDFIFNANDRNFLASMCYFHVDRFQNYINTELGITNAANYSIPVDPQGFNGDDNSHYVPNLSPGTGRIAFGEGGIPDAADAMVVLHEYGHAIQDNSTPGFNNPVSGVGEGFGDFLAAVYYDDKHTNPATTRGVMMSWDANTTDGTWAGRRYDMNWLFDGPEYTGTAENHFRGQLWCAAMFELYRKLGGDSPYAGNKHRARDLAIRLHLQANFNVPASNASAQQMGQQVEAADSNLAGWRFADGLHRKVVYDTFRRRRLAGYTDRAIDVYVNDGREGGYGSLSGTDGFNEVLWQDVFWDCHDIWVRTTPYASAADQAAGGPSDHVQPPVDSPAHVYVRVKNKGTSAVGSGPVKVRAFHCDPGIGLVWPDDFAEMDATAVTQPANILPGTASGVVVGPFTWTPTEVGHECLLVIVECPNDQAVSETLASSAHVGDGQMVPFDNNIAQRNISPVPAKARTLRRFLIRNPEEGVRIISLDFQSTLPRDWHYHTNLINPKSLRLGPLEKRWVEVTIDQAGGAEVEQFDNEHALRVTGSIEDRVIGGMTFYVAPPSAFGDRPEHAQDGRTLVHPADLFCLNIPWAECEVDGEIDVRLKFHQK